MREKWSRNLIWGNNGWKLLTLGNEMGIEIQVAQQTQLRWTKQKQGNNKN